MSGRCMLPPQPSRFRKVSFAEAFALLKKRIRETDKLPMFAYFSDSFPHVTKTTKLNETEMSLRNLGYLGWDEETAYSDLWINRLSMIRTIWDRANRTVAQEEAVLQNSEMFKSQGIIHDAEYEEDVRLHHMRLKNAQRERARYNSEIQAILSLIHISEPTRQYS